MPRLPTPRPWPHKLDYVVKAMSAMLRALPTESERTIALAAVLATLQHSDDLTGLTNIFTTAGEMTNHYLAVIE